LRAALATFALLLALTPLGHAAALPHIEVLFLGDKGHHKPAARAAELVPALAEKGIAVEYTDDINVLNAERLSQYDALILYANYDEISPAQESALLHYVEGGGAFVPLHCASYCFRNSEKFVALVGGQFARHGTGEFVAEIADRDHPITDRMLEFRTWDETYVHTAHADDRHILMLREDDEGKEPYTWTRSHGKGRVFYTAYGHDARTFTNPGFVKLVANGVRWAARKLPPPASKSPFEYEKAKIAFYPPRDAPGIVQDAPTRMQLPLSPKESVKHMGLPADFSAALYVSEPQIVKVIAMNWDERGRLWVAETVDYPNDLRRPPEGNDRITICEDTDGDGTADKFTVFADKLSIPTSLVFANGGLIVAQAPDMLFLKDTNGDDVADERQVLFTGWGTADTHSGPSNLRLGLDNWIWGTVGYSGFKGEVGGKRHEFRMGVIRFRPDGSEMEFVAATNNNTWGLGLTETGEVFVSTANGNHMDYVPIPNRYYEDIRGYTGNSGAQPIHDHKNIHPITPNVRQVDWHEQFTAAAGCAIYTARSYPEFYWNRVAFVTEPTGHLVHQCILEPDGSDYVAKDGWNLLASVDEWTAPVAAEVGPDGNVWVSDWYNYIVQHNPTPSGFENGAGNAYITPLRDKTHGRIYRVVHGDSLTYAPLDLGDASTEDLVAALGNDNMFWRTTAQRVLVERQSQDAVPALVELTRDVEMDDIGNAPGPLHALATLEGLDYFEDGDNAARVVLRDALGHPAPAVRRLAARFSPRMDGLAKDVTRLLHDDDPKVRLDALLSLADMEASIEIGATIEAAYAFETAASPLDSASRKDQRWFHDKWLSAASRVAAARHDVGFLLAAAGSLGAGPEAKPSANIRAVANHYARGRDHSALVDILRACNTFPDGATGFILEGLSAGWREDVIPDDLGAARKALIEISGTSEAEILLPAISLARKWGIEDAFSDRLDSLVARYRHTLADSSEDTSFRLQAARALVKFRPGTATRGHILDQISPSGAPRLATALIESLGEDASPGTAQDLLAKFDSFMPSARRQAVDVLLSRTDWSLALVTTAESGAISMPNLTVVQQGLLLDSKDETLQEKARALLARAGGRQDASREEIVQSLLPLTKEDGDLALGKQAFEENCATCHTFNGEGGKIAPDLTGIAGGNREEILIAIMDPNRSVEGNFRQWSVETVDGYSYSGLLTDELETSFTIHDALGNAHAILREDVESLSQSELSVMPEGFEALPPEMISGLLTYLTESGDFATLDLRKAANSISDQPMFTPATDPGGHHERLLFEKWGRQTFDGVPYYVLDPKAGSTPNLIMLHSPSSEVVKKNARSVSVPCGRPASAIHLLSGVSGWGHPIGKVGSTSMIVRVHYAGGETEDHTLKNGLHFADYIREIEVPESRLAFKLGPRQLRQLTIHPKQPEVIESIEFIKGDDKSAPIVMAVTVETH
jgi:uncharacterized protein